MPFLNQSPVPHLTGVAWGIVLGLGGWSVAGAIAPPAVQAYEARLVLTLEHEPGDSYQTLIRRAEALARAGAQRSFDNDILVTEVDIVVNGEHDGLEAPLLSMNVSRVQWRNHPDPQRWARYFPDSQALLVLDFAPPPPTTAAPAEPGEPVLGTGDVQVTLRWATLDDLDLWVTDPSGNRAYYGNSSVPSGGMLDVDANAGCGEQNSRPVENVFWPIGGAPTGSYLAQVDLFQRCTEATDPISFTLRILVQGEVQTITGTIDSSQPTLDFPFTLP